MKGQLSDWKGIVAIGGVVLVLGYIIIKGSEDAIVATATAINPVNPDNVINRGVNAVGTTLSRDPYWTLGGWLYDITHPITHTITDPTPLPPADASAPGGR